MKLLLAEDDPMLGASIEKGLRMAGHVLDWVRDGKSAMLALEVGGYDVLLLDLGLPRQDGLAVLKSLRQQDNMIPTLIVTARDGVADRVSGLNLGADDYLVKPFDLDELLARINAVHRRHAGWASSVIEFAGLRINPVTHEVLLEGKEIALSPREFALLHCLIEVPGAVLSREQLEDRLYGWDDEIVSNAVEVHLHKVRRKIGADRIRNVRGVGYKLVAP